MRLRLLLFSAALFLCPAPAGAALVLHVDHVGLAPSEVDRTVYLDVYLEDPDGVNERLDSFYVTVRAPAHSSDGVRFLPAGELPAGRLPSAEHPYVFSAINVPPVVWESDATTFAATQELQAPGTGVDVSDDLNGLFSVPVFVPAHTPAGTYPVVGDGDPRFSILGPSITFVVGPPGGVTIVPEPAALLPLAAAFPLLRRRIERLGMRAGGRGRSGARSEPR